MTENKIMNVQTKAVDNIFDTNGVITKAPFKMKMIIMPVVFAALLIIGNQLPLSQFGENTGLALGFFIGIIACFIVQPWDMVITAFMIPLGGYLLGFWNWNVFQEASGSSTFVSMFALTLVAAGAETTPIGKRIALWFLKKFHDKPVKMVMIMGAATCVITMFVSNAATLILMSGIANSMLLTMGEKPGHSRIGRVLMVVIPAASFFGGIGLISGAAAANLFGINMLEAATEGAYTITYAQWAAVGVPTVLLMAVPMCLIYAKGMKLSDSDINTMLPDEYFQNLISELGPIGGSEIRWIIITAVMIIAMMAGGHSVAIPLIAACATVMPLIGTVPAKDMFKHVPLKMLFMIFFITTLGKLFSLTGLGALLTTLLTPLFAGFSPYMFSVVTCLILIFLVNTCVSATAVFTLVLGITIPICINAGFNPSVVLMPTMMSSSFFFVLRLNVSMLLNKDYGWWELKDGILPGTIVAVILAFLIPALAMLICPMAGMPIYLP